MRAYFDSSALVKLLIHEQGSDWCAEVWEGASAPFTSSVTYVEVRAALAAAARAGRVKRVAIGATRSRFELIWDEIGVIECDSELILRAGDIAEDSALRGYDAVHLASAITLDSAQPLQMLTWDRDLARASSDSGINVIGSLGT